MIELPTLKELLEAGAHFGHKKERTYPKARQYTFMLKDQIYVINLEKTQELLAEALKYLDKIASEGKTVLLVGTKRQAQEIIFEHAKKADLPYVNYRWLGGMLTNFETIKKRIKFMDELDRKLAEEEGKVLTKKEKSKLQEQADKLHKMFDGIKNMKKLPDVLFVVDIARERIALTEADKMGIPVVGIADTNANPTLIKYPIPANDDARKTLEIIVGLVVRTVQEGSKKIRVTPASEAKAESK